MSRVPWSTRLALAFYAGMLGWSYVKLPESLAPRETAKRASRPKEPERSKESLFGYQELNLGKRSASAYSAQVTLEGPLAYSQIRLTFPAGRARERSALLRCSIPNGAWIDRLEVSQGSFRQSASLVAVSKPEPPERPKETGELPPLALLRVQVPLQISAEDVQISFGYLERCRPQNAYRLPLSAFLGPAQVHFEALSERGDRVERDCDTNFGGDLSIRRDEQAEELFGKGWGVLSRPSNKAKNWSVGSGPRAQDAPCYWVEGQAKNIQQLKLWPDRWVNWAKADVIVSGKKAPTPEEMKTLLQERIHTPFTRFRFGQLAPGGLVEVLPVTSGS
jgi:hypothetical protein